MIARLPGGPADTYRAMQMLGGEHMSLVDLLQKVKSFPEVKGELDYQATTFYKGI